MFHSDLYCKASAVLFSWCSRRGSSSGRDQYFGAGDEKEEVRKIVTLQRD